LRFTTTIVYVNLESSGSHYQPTATKPLWETGEAGNKIGCRMERQTIPSVG
jgi:hypothetical protein